jgi:hypothetical protein
MAVLLFSGGRSSSIILFSLVNNFLIWFLERSIRVTVTLSFLYHL